MAVAAIPIVISVLGALQKGKADSQAAGFQAKQLDRNAMAAKASSQRVAMEDRRNAEIVQSRARALIAAGGGSTTDIGASDLLAKISAEGEYNAITSLFEGSQQSAGLQTAAKASRYGGDTGKRESKMRAASTVLSSFGSSAAGRSYG